MDNRIRYSFEFIASFDNEVKAGEFWQSVRQMAESAGTSPEGGIFELGQDDTYASPRGAGLHLFEAQYHLRQLVRILWRRASRLVLWGG